MSIMRVLKVLKIGARMRHEDDLSTRRGVAIYKSNPFMMEVSTRVRRVTNKRGDMVLVNSETGEIQSNIAGFWESEEVDSTKFVKLFIQGVKALKELTGAGTKVFEVLYFQVQENIGKDKIYMSLGDVDQTLTPMSKATYMRGLRELIQKDFIAATQNTGWYWLNPSFVWNGDRLAFVKTYRKTSRKPPKDTLTGDLFSVLETAQTYPAVAAVPSLSVHQE
jgi:hypothetical protein